MKWLDKYINKYFARKAIELVSQKLNLIYISEKEIIKSDCDSYYLMIKGKKYRTRFVEIMFEDGLEAYMRFYNMTDQTICLQAETLLEKIDKLDEEEKENE